MTRGRPGRTCGEERQLLNVALTQARRGVVLIVPAWIRSIGVVPDLDSQRGQHTARARACRSATCNALVTILGLDLPWSGPVDYANDHSCDWTVACLGKDASRDSPGE